MDDQVGDGVRQGLKIAGKSYTKPSPIIMCICNLSSHSATRSFRFSTRIEVFSVQIACQALSIVQWISQPIDRPTTHANKKLYLIYQIHLTWLKLIASSGNGDDATTTIAIFTTTFTEILFYRPAHIKYYVLWRMKNFD